MRSWRRSCELGTRDQIHLHGRHDRLDPRSYIEFRAGFFQVGVDRSRRYVEYRAYIRRTFSEAHPREAF